MNLGVGLVLVVTLVTWLGLLAYLIIVDSLATQARARGKG